MNFEQWKHRYPEASAALAQVFAQPATEPKHDGHSESWAQQRVRMQIAKRGGFAYRNNVGVTKHECPECKAPMRPIRYGLANDSKELNAIFKSADLIGFVPRVIMPEHVGRVIAQFASWEAKPPGWQFTGKGREGAQAKWAVHVNEHGGWAEFTTGTTSI